MRSRTQPRTTRRRGRPNRPPVISHRHVTHDPASTGYLATLEGRSFIDGCLQAVTNGDWGLVSNSEAAANNRAPTGGHIEAAFLVPDDLDAEQVLLIDVIHVGTRRSRTTVRLLDPAAVSV